MNIFALILSCFLLLTQSPDSFAATFVVGSNYDTADQNIGDGICNTALGPPENCSLKAAIQEANFSASSDTIIFSKPLTFSLNSSTSPLVITENNLTIDGSSQWNTAAGTPGIVIDHSNYGDLTSLKIMADNTVIKGLLFQGRGTNIFVQSGTGNRIGGPNEHESNVFYGVDTGVYLESPSQGTTIQYNYFGTKHGETYGLDTTYLGNIGIHAFATGAGTDTIIEYNVIGEQKKGIFLEAATSVKVRSNLIGEPFQATNQRIGNEIGIALYNTDAEIYNNTIAYNTIAQISTVYGNSAGIPTISDNYIGESFQSVGEGIFLNYPQSGSTISGNLIRYAAGHGISIIIGRPAILNNSIYYNMGDGILLHEGLQGTTVSGNTIYGNHGNGIVLDNSDEVVVSGNTIGSSSKGGNRLSGIRIENGSKNNLIGGLDTAAQNSIGYNYKSGIYITDAGTTDNDIAGNIIGAGPHFYNIAVGYLKAGNGNHGIALYNNAESNNIGLSGDLISPNIILNNSWSGIAIVNSNHNRIFGNMVGTDGGSRPWGNAYYGIHVVNGNNNIIKYNEVTNNGFQTPARPGIAIQEAVSFGNQLSENSIYHNGAAGIDLINGSNMNIQPPTLQRSGNIFAGTTCANCTVELFSGRDDDEGAYYEGSVKANGLGNYSLLMLSHVKGNYVTATATSTPNLNTSEFSLPVEGYTFPWAEFLPAMFHKH